MEVVIYAAFSAIWWLSSISVLLPFVLLLKFSKTFRDKWFSFFFINIVEPLFNRKLIPFRKRTFELLNEHLKKSSTKQIEILEIGIGGGANLAYYPTNSNLTALDMNESFEVYLEENKRKYPNITYKRTIHAKAENMTEIADSSIDVVIGTYVLCSIEDINLVFAEVIRVLKPGGKYAFLEHGAFPKSQWSFTIQHLVSPLWKTYFNGCILDRDIGDKIQRSRFSDVALQKEWPNSLALYVRPQILGVATK